MGTFDESPIDDGWSNVVISNGANNLVLTDAACSANGTW